MDFSLPLDETQISHAAENMIRQHGSEALTKADDRAKNSKAEGSDWYAKTWDLIREVIKDEQDSDDKIRGCPPINSHPVGAEILSREDDCFEPLGEVEQALLNGWLNVEGPKGCQWINDANQHCSQPLARLSSRSPYCEEHLRRSLTKPGWRRLLATAGREPELPSD